MSRGASSVMWHITILSAAALACDATPEFALALRGTVGGSPAQAIIKSESIALVKISETWVGRFIIPSWSNGGAAVLPGGSVVVANWRDHKRCPSLNRLLSVTCSDFMFFRCAE